MIFEAHNPNLLSFEQARIALGVSRQTIYNMLKRNELTPTKIIPLGKQQRKFFSKQEVLEVKAKRNPDL